MLDLRVGLLSLQRYLRAGTLSELPKQHDVRQLVDARELQPVHGAARVSVAIFALIELLPVELELLGDAGAGHVAGPGRGRISSVTVAARPRRGAVCAAMRAGG